jgi:uncharacterized membrane protein YkvA (DUF1232 family)
MTTRISLTLSNRDLRYFRDAVHRAREAVSVADEDEIIDAIGQVIADIRSKGPLPDFIAGRMPELEGLIDMLGDADWQLPARERGRLLATFVYFCDPEDLIPDDIPGIGYLDDVIMIELLLREMRHVSAAYADFCATRRTLADGETSAAKAGRRLERRRKELHERMRRRYQADRNKGIGRGLW